jgi:hypothetical protein
MRVSLWTRWTASEVGYLTGHAEDSTEAIAAALGRDPSAVRRKRYSLGLMLSPERKLAIIGAARRRRKGIWPVAQKRVLEDHGPQLLDAYGRACDQHLKPLIDAAGVPRTLSAIQQMRSRLGITETKDVRIRRLREAAKLIDHAKLRQIPSTLTWEDLSPIAQAVFLGSLLGDGGTYEANGSHYYSETHKLPHKEYLIWKRDLLPTEFQGNFREEGPQKKDQRCIWETGVSQIFTMLRGHFYLDAKRGFKTAISDWVIEQIDLVVMLIWLLDDGRNNLKDNGLPNLEIAVPRWNRQHVERVCEALNDKYGFHLRISPRDPRPGAVNNIVIPAKDRDCLLPAWWKFSDDYSLPDCMRYKIPRYNPPINGRRRLHWEEEFGTDVNGLRTVVFHIERVALARTAFTMRQNGASLKAIGDFLATRGHVITPRYLSGVWGRLYCGQVECGPVTEASRHESEVRNRSPSQF